MRLGPRTPYLNSPFRSSESPECTESRCDRPLRARYTTIVVPRYQIKNVLNVTALVGHEVVNCGDGRSCCLGPGR